jgi:hypothetical protein
MILADSHRVRFGRDRLAAPSGFFPPGLLADAFPGLAPAFWGGRAPPVLAAGLPALLGVASARFARAPLRPGLAAAFGARLNAVRDRG